MSRSCPYRREVSDACNWHQDEALNSTIFILHQTGPTGFLLKEEGEHKNFKVFLGDVHTCTCPVFKKEKDLCKHVCWLLLKKFRVLRSDPLSWQLGLNEREINGIIRGDTAQGQQQASRSKPVIKKADANDTSSSNEIEQRPITAADVCPICQDEFLSKKLPVSYCRFGCGNNVHIKCMKVWADHQKSNGETTLRCPLCREAFSSFELLDQEYRNNGLFKTEKQDLHYGLSCRFCKSSPINGKCYKCTTCAEFYLCQPCFNTDFHREHMFVFREKYRKATRDHAGLLPLAVTQNLAQREITEADYDLLVQLDGNNNLNTSSATQNYSQIPEKVIKSWPSERIRENSLLLNPGYQCRICLRPYQASQIVRKLPNCKHKFHIDCIDNWLLHSHPTCPIDGQVVWDPITAQLEKEEKKQNKAQNTKTPIKSNNIHRSAELEVPGLGLIINYKTCILEKPPKNDPQNKLDISKSLKSKANGSSPNLAKIQNSATSTPLKTLSASQITTKNKFKIEVEGRNLSATALLDNIDDYTNQLAVATAGSNLNQNIEVANHINKMITNNNKFRTLQQIPKSIPNNKSTSNVAQFPQIEIKGHNFDTQSNEFDLNVKSNTIPNSTVNINSHSLNKKATLLNDADLFRRRNSDAEIPFKDAFNVSAMLNSKPYQLSRLSKKSSISGLSNDKQSDFFLYEDESDSYSEVPMPPPNNVKNDLFLYNPPHNSFALSHNNMFTIKDNQAETNSNNNFDIAEHESTIFIEANQQSSNHLLFNSDNNQSLNSNKTTGVTKMNQKKFNYRQPPPVKKPPRTSNNDFSIEEIQANLPSVLIINSNNSSSGTNKPKIEEEACQKSLINKHIDDHSYIND